MVHFELRVQAKIKAKKCGALPVQERYHGYCPPQKINKIEKKKSDQVQYMKSNVITYNLPYYVPNVIEN